MKPALRSVGCLFDSSENLGGASPDDAPHVQGCPDGKFVLCRNTNGDATAVYGQAIWDFNPYRLSARKVNRIDFRNVFPENNNQTQLLVAESKYILYCVIYFGSGGKIGKISIATLLQYWMVLRRGMQFCYAQRLKPQVGILSIKQLFMAPIYLAAFIQGRVDKDKSVLTGLLNQLVRCGNNRLGYQVLNPRSFALKRPDSKQCPIIPTRIYLELINRTGDLLDQLHPGIEHFEKFIINFADDYYGTLHSNQRSKGVGGRAFYRPEFREAVRQHGLESAFSGEFYCGFKRGLKTALIKMQYVIKTIIHLYTGMRDQEVMRLSYDCVRRSVERDQVVDDRGKVRDDGASVCIISTTTKFSGYKKEGVWFAPEEVVRAVEIAQALCRGLARLYKVEVGVQCPLFPNPSILSFTRNISEVTVAEFKPKRLKIQAFDSIAILQEDLVELAQSDPSRDFYTEACYEIGKSWPLTSHQFRRSLAFYGSSSGFVSLPTLRAQFKHLTIQMSRYYSNNYENLKTIFGYFDKDKNDYIMPTNHFAFEFQMAMPMSVANQLISDLLMSEKPIFGGTGSYIQKQRDRLKSGEILIEDVRADTEQRANSGSLSYRKTLLGGCTKAGRCDDLLFGNYTECLSCESAVIELEKVDSALSETGDELTLYADGTGEYQIIKDELDRLVAFQQRFK